jgi:hypothetical protein
MLVPGNNNRHQLFCAMDIQQRKTFSKNDGIIKLADFFKEICFTSISQAQGLTTHFTNATPLRQ